MATTAKQIKPKSKKYSVGDKMFVVETLSHRNPRFHEVAIEKVGPKYITFSLYPGQSYRATVEGLAVFQGEYSCRNLSVYKSRDEYEHEIAMAKAWNDIRKCCGDTYRPPSHLTLDQARQILAILKPEEAQSDD